MDRQIRVLVVEDNRRDLELTRAAIAKVRKYRVSYATRLTEALPILVRRQADVVLLDLSLPDSAGVATVERVRVMAPQVPIIVLTGAVDDRVGLECMEAGANDYLSKSDLTDHTLERSLGYVLERGRRRQARRLAQALDRYRELLSAGAGDPVERRRSDALLRARNPRVAEVIDRHYLQLLNAYVAHVVDKSAKPTALLESLATCLGELGAGTRDFLSWHVSAVEAAVEESNVGDARLCASAGRLLALDMMGCMLDYYRVGRRKAATLAGDRSSEARP